MKRRVGKMNLPISTKLLANKATGKLCKQKGSEEDLVWYQLMFWISQLA
jgi:hypothetical protein